MDNSQIDFPGLIFHSNGGVERVKIYRLYEEGRVYRISLMWSRRNAGRPPKVNSVFTEGHIVWTYREHGKADEWSPSGYRVHLALAGSVPVLAYVQQGVDGTLSHVVPLLNLRFKEPVTAACSTLLKPRAAAYLKMDYLTDIYEDCEIERLEVMQAERKTLSRFGDNGISMRTIDYGAGVIVTVH